jgi:hypothetical protein
MEIIGLTFVAGLVMKFLDRQERRRLFPPAPCKHCDQWVFLEGDEWVHEDGSHFAEWPRLDYVTFPNSPLHPAIPLSTGGIS